MNVHFSYSKKDKLKSKRRIEDIFTNGKHIIAYPVKIFYLFEESMDEKNMLQVGIGVSKKYFKHAVKRNRVKRLLRESYRLNHTHLKEEIKKRNKNVYLFLLYNSKEILSYKDVEEKVKKLLNIITKKYCEENS